MQILGYNDKFVELSELRKHGKSEAYIAGYRDGYVGSNEYRPQKPKAPILQVKTIENGRFEVYGDTYQYKDHLKRLGGSWFPQGKSWTFSGEQIPILKIDKELNLDKDLWSGIPEHEPERMQEALTKHDQDLKEYGEGYVAGQVKACRQSVSKITYR